MNTLEKLQAIIDHCKCDVSLEVRPNTGSYLSVEKYFDNQFGGGDIDDNERLEIAACIDADIIYKLHVYPATPIGSYCTYGPSLEVVVDSIFEALSL